MGVVVYAYGSTSEVAWLFLLAYWLWALAIAGGLYAAWNARGLEATAELRPADTLFEGDEADLVVGLRSVRGTRDRARKLTTGPAATGALLILALRCHLGQGHR